MIPPKSMILSGRARVAGGEPKALSPVFAGRGSYRGASGRSRQLREWNPQQRSADEDSIPDLPTLRGRTRDLDRNSPIAGGAVNTAVTSIVGPGMMLQAGIDRDVLGISEEEAKAWERRTELLFRLWCRQCDIRGRQHFGPMQGTVLNSQLVSGDLFVLRRYRDPRTTGHILGTKIQLVEADRVCTPPEHVSDMRITDGIELNRFGGTAAVWVKDRARGDQPERWKRIPHMGAATRNRQVIHLADLKRPDQTRGVPYLAPIIEILKQLERYTESELAAAVISSFFTVFTKTEGAVGLANETATAADDGTVDSESRDQKLAPAAIIDLDPGEDIEVVDPARPNSAFDPFIMSMMTQIGMLTEIPFEVLTKHFKASYSAARGAVAEAWRFFMKRRTFLGQDFCDPIYEWFLAEAVLIGLIDAPGFGGDPLVRQAWLGAQWIGPARGHIDPTKEVAAIKEMKAEGWISDSEATQELRGLAYEDVVSRRKRDEMVRTDAGIEDPAPAPSPEPAPPEPEPNPDLPDEEDAA